MASSRREPRPTELLAKAVALYEVSIDRATATADSPSDADLVSSYARARGALVTALTQKAVRRFGPGFAVEAPEATSTAGVHASVMLGLRYPARAVAVTSEELARFAGEVETAVAEGLDDPRGASLEVAARLDEAWVSPPEDPAATQPWERLAPVLAALGTGLGVLGFITFVGGAVLWARFTGAGIAAEQALSVVPSQDLVVTGAVALTPALAAALLSTAALFVIRTIVSDPPAGKEPRLRNLVARLDDWQDELRASAIALFVLIAQAIALTVVLDITLGVDSLVFVLAGLTLALLVGCIAYRTPRFVYLAVSTFLAVSLFLGGVTFYRELVDAEVRAAAVVRKNQKAVIGFYVAEGANRVFLGRLAFDESPPGNVVVDTGGSRIFAIDKAEISDIAVGPLKPLVNALGQASELANELCEIQLVRPQAGGKTKKAKALELCWELPPGEKVR